MTEQTQTERLSAEFMELLKALGQVNVSFSNSVVREALVKTLLKTCKEAGLEFVKRYKSGGRILDYSFEEIEI